MLAEPLLGGWGACHFKDGQNGQFSHSNGETFNIPVEITEARRLSGGASRESWWIDARDGDGAAHELVLRRDPGALAGQSSRDTEFRLLAAAHAAGVAAPEPLLLLDPDDGLGTGFFMRRIAGETIQSISAEDYAGLIVTDQRMLNFNGETGVWAEQDRRVSR